MEEVMKACIKCGGTENEYEGNMSNFAMDATYDDGERPICLKCEDNLPDDHKMFHLDPRWFYDSGEGHRGFLVSLGLDPENIEIDEDDVSIGHEASVSKVGEDQIFYLMSRGLSEEAASSMVVSGFIEPLVKELPMEYAVEMNRLIQLQMEGSIG